MKSSTRIIALGVVVVLGTGALGCKKLFKRRATADAGMTTLLTAPPIPVWKDSEVTLSGTSGRGRFFLRDTKLDVSFSQLPEGTKLSSGDQSDTAKSFGSAALSIDLTDRLAKLSPRDAFDYKFKLDPKVKVRLDFGNNITLDLDAPATSVNYGLGELFKKVPDAPFTLGTAAPPKEHTILFVGGLSPEPLGTATTVDAIDWVALPTNLPPRPGRTCSGYKATGKSGTTGTKSYVLAMVDQKLSIYEVRTGKEIASKDFKAENKCPMMAFGGEAKSYASSTEQKAWLRAQRTKN